MSKNSTVALGYMRLPEVLRHIPVSRSTWWLGVRNGRFPKPVKLGPRTTAWRTQDIHDLIARLDNAGGEA